MERDRKKERSCTEKKIKMIIIQKLFETKCQIIL
jgi:hypothetical protein